LGNRGLGASLARFFVNDINSGVGVGARYIPLSHSGYVQIDYYRWRGLIGSGLWRIPWARLQVNNKEAISDF